jgi:hypothetical protein
MHLLNLPNLIDAYTQLRKRARAKRDESIREARSLYDQALKRIRELLEQTEPIL